MHLSCNNVGDACEEKYYKKLLQTQRKIMSIDSPTIANWDGLDCPDIRCIWDHLVALNSIYKRPDVQ